MKYHYTKPTEYSSMYGQLYECNHPAYNHCTLYLIGDKGLAVIQQRYDKKSKCTWWSEIDRCLTDVLYLHSKFKSVFDKYASAPMNGLYPSIKMVLPKQKHFITTRQKTIKIKLVLIR